MTPTSPASSQPSRQPAGALEHVDVLIVGAGLSGIGAASHLQARLPGKSYAILEARDAVGGTWDLFRYPGIRSDSDMQTLGYRFRPWSEDKAIADGPSILRYVRETAGERGIDERIRFNHRVVSADWSSTEARWTIEAVRTDGGASGTHASNGAHKGVGGELVRLTCGFLFACGGYYRYDEGFTPRFEGADRFEGPIVHPQHWPQELDYAGKRIVVIGSGATAVTLVPALAERAAHVTMLQRSPTYVISIPSADALANGLRRLLGERRAYAITRRKKSACRRSSTGPAGAGHDSYGG